MSTAASYSSGSISNGNVIIRPGRKGDHPAIQEFTSNTFPWGDYVAKAFLKWVEESPDVGQTYVAELSGKPVGVTHVRYISPEEAWFEGIRVHPNFRRLGIGEKLTLASIQGARLKGVKVCRSAIDLDNEKSSGLAAKLGFKIVATILEYSRDYCLEPGNAENEGKVSQPAPEKGSHPVTAENRPSEAPLSEAPGEDGESISVRKASTDDVPSIVELARKDLTLIGSDFVWRSITDYNLTTLSREGSILVACKKSLDPGNGTDIPQVLAGASWGGFWVEDESTLMGEIGTPFGSMQGVQAIAEHLAAEAVSRAKSRNLDKVTLIMGVEKGTSVSGFVDMLGFKALGGEEGENIWELKLEN